MKKVGIVIRDFEENDKLFVGRRKDVIDVFLKYSVQVILIPIYFPFSQVLHLVSLCDGIVLSGGDHFDVNDFLLVKYLYDENIPTLGICLGMQAIALSFGGEEINVCSDHYHGIHEIFVKQSTLLHQILKEDHIIVNSRHKTGVIYSTLEVSAKSLEGIVEAIEDKSKKFFLGVEWHPESFANKKSDLIFESFIKSLD